MLYGQDEIEIGLRRYLQAQIQGVPQGVPSQNRHDVSVHFWWRHHVGIVQQPIHGGPTGQLQLHRFPIPVHLAGKYHHFLRRHKDKRHERGDWFS